MKIRLPLCVVLLSACSNTNNANLDLGPDLAIAPLSLLQACDDSLDDVYVAPPGLPAWDASHRGDVVRCALDQRMPVDQLNAQAIAYGYNGPPLPSGATIYRITFRTERMAPAGTAAPGGLSSALLLIPSVPHGSGALAVYAHPSVGIADACAPSKQRLSDPSSGWDPVRVPLLALAGYGWTVIAPDQAGFGFGAPPGWSVAEDEAHGVLDATRAAQKILPADLLPSQVVLLGHSQGGHAVLAAHALAGSYGAAGNIVGVVGLAPLWITAYAWGAGLSPLAQFNTTDNGYFIEYAMDYFYSHGELYDGPGGGLAMLQPAKRAQAQALLTGQCLDDFNAQLPSLGKTPADFFDPQFVDSVGQCGIGLTDCTDSPASIWKPRFLADRPPLAANGPPVVLYYGGQDTTISPGFAQCELDKIHADLAQTPGATVSLTVCGDADAEHTTIVARDADWVNQWIAARATGDPEPAPCAAPAPPDGGAVCTTPPPNL